MTPSAPFARHRGDEATAEDLAREAIAHAATDVLKALGLVAQGARTPTIALNKIADYLTGAGVAKAKPLAEVLLMTLEGALLLSRARRNCAPPRQFKRHAAQLLGDAK